MTRWSAPTPRAPTLLWECFSTTSSTSRTASRCPLPWVIQRVRAMLVLWSSLQLTGDVCAKSCCGAARFRTASATGPSSTGHRRHHHAARPNTPGTTRRTGRSRIALDSPTVHTSCVAPRKHQNCCPPTRFPPTQTKRWTVICPPGPDATAHSCSGCPLGSLRVTAGLGEELVLEGLACLQGSGGTVFGVRPGGVCGESAAELSFLRCERHSVLLKYQGGDSCRNRLECRRPGWARTRP